MDRTGKELIASEVKARFDKMTSVVFVNFQGLTVEQVSNLRGQFRKAGVDYKVVKNTILRRVLADKPWAPQMKDVLVGMTGVAWSYEDPSAAAKVLKAFRKDAENEKLGIKAGVVDGSVLGAKAVEDQLATMPGKDELRAMLLATLQAPLTQFVQQLSAPLQNFVYLLKAKEDAA